jgi:hypothetical protein
VSICKVKQSQTHLQRRREERRYTSYTFMISELDGGADRHVFMIVKNVLSSPK